MFNSRYAWLVVGLLWAAPTQAAYEIYDDRGGEIEQYVQKYRHVDYVAIRGTCASACTIALGLPPGRVCVSPGAVLGFHQAYMADRRTGQRLGPSPIGTRMVWNSYPAQLRQRLGHLTVATRWLRGSELIRLGVTQCPT